MQVTTPVFQLLKSRQDMIKQRILGSNEAISNASSVGSICTHDLQAKLLPPYIFSLPICDFNSLMGKLNLPACEFS